MRGTTGAIPSRFQTRERSASLPLVASREQTAMRKAAGPASDPTASHDSGLVTRQRVTPTSSGIPRSSGGPFGVPKLPFPFRPFTDSVLMA